MVDGGVEADTSSSGSLHGPQRRHAQSGRRPRLGRKPRADVWWSGKPWGTMQSKVHHIASPLTRPSSVTVMVSSGSRSLSQSPKEKYAHSRSRGRGGASATVMSADSRSPMVASPFTFSTMVSPVNVSTPSATLVNMGTYSSRRWRAAGASARSINTCSQGNWRRILDSGYGLRSIGKRVGGLQKIGPSASRTSTTGWGVDGGGGG